MQMRSRPLEIYTGHSAKGTGEPLEVGVWEIVADLLANDGNGGSELFDNDFMTGAFSLFSRGRG